MKRLNEKADIGLIILVAGFLIMFFIVGGFTLFADNSVGDFLYGDEEDKQNSDSSVMAVSMDYLSDNPDFYYKKVVRISAFIGEEDYLTGLTKVYDNGNRFLVKGNGVELDKGAEYEIIGEVDYKNIVYEQEYVKVFFIDVKYVKGVP